MAAFRRNLSRTLDPGAITCDTFVCFLSADEDDVSFLRPENNLRACDLYYV